MEIAELAVLQFIPGRGIQNSNNVSVVEFRIVVERAHCGFVEESISVRKGVFGIFIQERLLASLEFL